MLENEGYTLYTKRGYPLLYILKDIYTEVDSMKRRHSMLPLLGSILVVDHRTEGPPPPSLLPAHL